MSKAKTKGLSVFVPLQKVDEEQRLVYGRITAQEMDQSGETMDYETSKPNFQKWSGDIETASGGLSKGNLRIMHGLKVGGKLTDIAYNDDEQCIDVCAKVTDDAEWNNVLEGCYTGFSVGGRYAKKWTENVDGVSVAKYTASPNEVSLVDNPCVKSATFQLIKADGVVEDHEIGTPIAQGSIKDVTEEEVLAAASPPETVNTETAMEPTASEVAAKATEIALGKADGSSWMDHIPEARDLLMKASKSDDDKSSNKDDKSKSKKEDDKDTSKSDDDKGAGKDKSDDDKSEGDDKSDDDDKSEKADFTAANRLSQKWVTTDGKSFVKKADAEAHEDELLKAANMTDLDRLKERLAKATETPTVLEVPLEEDYTRMGNVVNALLTKFEGGQPVLEKGMYTVSSFARLLWDLGKIACAIKQEGVAEGGDGDDASVWTEIHGAMSTLGDSLKAYLANQITEMLAGINDDELACVYDYYYCAAQANGDDALAKDVCSVIELHKDASRETRDTLQKAFTVVIEPEAAIQPVDNELQKRFDKMEEENGELKKLAGDAIGQVEVLSKRVQTLEDTPLPRAPNPQNVAWKDGDQREFFGKSFTGQDELRAHLHNMIQTQGPDAVALELIKASHAGGGQRLMPFRQ